MIYKKYLCPCALDKSGLSIGRVKINLYILNKQNLETLIEITTHDEKMLTFDKCKVFN